MPVILILGEAASLSQQSEMQKHTFQVAFLLLFKRLKSQSFHSFP